MYHSIRAHACAALTLACFTGAAACTMDTEQQAWEDLDSAEQPIMNGKPGENTGLGSRVTVLLKQGSTTCSGVLVKPDWVVTSAHCLATTISNATHDPGDLKVYHNGIPIEPKWIAPHGHYSAADKSHDIGLVQLKYPVGSVAESGGWTVYFNDMAPAALVDNPLRCYGYGVYDAMGHSGELRTAELEVSAADSAVIKFKQKVSGPKLASGDSGGGCFMKYPPFGEPSDLPYLVSVNRMANSAGGDGVNATGYETWINETINDRLEDEGKVVLLPVFKFNPCFPWQCMRLASASTAAQEGWAPEAPEAQPSND